MKRFMTIVTLTFVLSTSTLAGDIPSVGLNSPGPEETTTAPSTLTPGEIPTVGFADEISNSALSFVQVMVDLVL